MSEPKETDSQLTALVDRLRVENERLQNDLDRVAQGLLNEGIFEEGSIGYTTMESIMLQFGKRMQSRAEAAEKENERLKKPYGAAYAQGRIEGRADLGKEWQKRAESAEARIQDLESEAFSLSAQICNYLTCNEHGNETCEAREELAAFRKRWEESPEVIIHADKTFYGWLDFLNCVKFKDGRPCRVRIVREEV